MALNFLNNGYFGGKLGIGTESPVRKLHIQDTTGNPQLVIGDGASIYSSIQSANSLYINAGDGGGGSTTIFRRGTSLTESMRITSGGKVGIGTNNPIKKLHVKETSGTFEAAIFETNSGGSFIRNIDSTGTVETGIQGGKWSARTSNTQRLVIDSSGNVGIGTTSPSVQLDIEDSSNVIVDMNTTTANANTTIRFQESGSAKATIGYDGTNDGLILTTGGFTAGNGIFIDDSQNVGIGETDPDRKLHVNSGSDNANTIFESTDTAVTIRLKDLTGSAEIESRNDFRFSNNAGVDQRMVISSAGAIRFNNYGAGTLVTDASGNITVSSGGGAGGPYLPLAGGTMTGTSSVLMPDSFKLKLGTGGDAIIQHNGSHLFIDNSAGSTYVRNTSTGSILLRNSTGGDIQFDNEFAGNILFNTSNIERMRIDSSGNVGIGVTAPTSSVHVNGLQTNSGSTSAHIPTGTMRLNFAGASSPDEYGASLVFTQRWWTGSTGEVAMGQITGVKETGNGNYGGGLAFFTSNNTSNNLLERLRINELGNVGIGTTSPDAKLDIEGDEASLRIKDTTSGKTWDWQVHSTYMEFGEVNVANNRLVIKNGGNVGIGTTNPNEKLQVAGNIHAYAPSGINAGLFASTAAGSTTIAIRSSGITHFNGGNVGIGTTGPEGKLNIETSAESSVPALGANTTFLKISNTGGGYGAMIGQLGSGNSYIQSQRFDGAATAYNLLLQPNGGNVGIGETNPNSRLIIKNTSANDGIRIHTSDTSEGFVIFRDDSGTSPGAVVYDHSIDMLGFKVNGVSDRMQILSTGQLVLTSYSSSGIIGTPTYLLGTDASGNVVKTTTIPGSAAGPYLPLAGGTMTGTNGVIFPDNFNLKIGTGSDLKIFHNATDSFIINEVGNLKITNGANDKDIIFESDNGSGGTTPYLTLDGSITKTVASKDIHFDGTVKATFGSNATPASIYYNGNEDVDTGTETVANVVIAIHTAAFFDFVIKKTTNVRSGTVYACHDGTTVQFTETSTQDLGDTSDVTLSVDISGGNMRLRATTTSDDWSIKSLIRAI